MQGRARSEIADLYRRRYQSNTTELRDLDKIVQNHDEFSSQNPGFRYVCQLVNVPDFKGKGESSPTAYFYQNLGEAEYIVAVYQYMRLLVSVSKTILLKIINFLYGIYRDIQQRKYLF